MARPQKFSTQRAIELFRETPSWRAVAKKLGVHPYSVQNALEPLGYIAIATVGQNRAWNVDDAVQLREKGMTYTQIAKVIGVSPSAIRKALVDLFGKGGRRKK